MSLLPACIPHLDPPPPCLPTACLQIYHYLACLSAGAIRTGEDAANTINGLLG